MEIQLNQKKTLPLCYLFRQIGHILFAPRKKKMQIQQITGKHQWKCEQSSKNYLIDQWKDELYSSLIRKKGIKTTDSPYIAIYYTGRNYSNIKAIQHLVLVMAEAIFPEQVKVSCDAFYNAFFFFLTSYFGLFSLSSDVFALLRSLKLFSREVSLFFISS